jgi:pyruvate,orthophosphate dikinase
MAKAKKYVYHFGKSKTDGNGTMKALLGGKGANLAEMIRIGLPVPPGFTLTTDVCTYYYAHKKSYPREMQAQIKDGVRRMEKEMGKKLGDKKNPLLLSVRSGARESMPGMMDTILNLGLNDDTVEALAKFSNNPRFAWDCYRRFIQMYGGVVMGVNKLEGEDEDPFEVIIEKLKKKQHGDSEAEDAMLTAKDMQTLVAEFKRLVMQRTGKAFPNDPWEQLDGSVGAVFNSWMNDRANVYRRKYNIPAEWGTAVNVQAMVFGNTGEDSGSGVAFTRDPATGENVFYGEFLMNAQGEDVVSGVRTPAPVAKLKKVMFSAHNELEAIRAKLERHFRDMQDFEFTIEERKVFMLQTRNGKRTGHAAVRIACEMVKEKLINWKTAVNRVPAEQLDQVLAPVFDAKVLEKLESIAKGLPAGPGAAAGRIYFNPERAEKAESRGQSVLLVREETTPEDLRGMIAADGILTAKGGVSSHAALVARQMGKVCVCGADSLHIDYSKRRMSVGRRSFKEGDYLSIDGTTGEIYSGVVKTEPSVVVQAILHNDPKAKQSRSFKNFNQLMSWCAKVSKMQVRTNADSPDQVLNAIAFGATGVGLCRTEHMFFEGDRINYVREMIIFSGDYSKYKKSLQEAEKELSGKKLRDKNRGLRKEHIAAITHFEGALKKLLPFQRKDFEGMFKALNGLPATIRLLDPPLHEFLPHDQKQIAALAKKMKVKPAEIQRRVNDLHEFNPMLGHRGCRLAISYPEITEMQAQAIFEAAANVQKKGIKVKPEVMVPLVGFRRELELQSDIIHRVAKEVCAKKKVKLNYLVGTMIEVPRGALTADEIAEVAQFFSFGTNDLTQTTMGMSRDDSGSFLPNYQEQDIIGNNPFAVIDQTGVGQLMEIAVKKGRSTRPKIKLGICGEHGGEPTSVKYCHTLGLNYVSCSPFRVPTARLAAAQAALA